MLRNIIKTSFNTSFKSPTINNINILSGRYPNILSYSKTVNQVASELDSSELFVAYSKLGKYDIKLDEFPDLAVVGPQSSGKSSVLEAFIGDCNILPKDQGQATNKPTHITTVLDQELKIIVGDREFKREQDAKDEIARANTNPNIDTIRIRMHAPNITNVSLIDLPGLFYVSENNSDLPKKFREMSYEYLQKDKIIPLVVFAAPTDPGTNEAMAMVNELKKSDKAIGVITKVDLTKGQKTKVIEDMLNNKRYKLGNGYVSVVLRNQQEILSGMTVSDKMEKEREFFNSNPNFEPCGVETMRRKVSNIQFKNIKHNLGHLQNEIDKQLDRLENSGTFLENIVSDRNKTLPIKLEQLIRKLVGSSLERAKFEKKLKFRLKEEISKHIDDTLQSIELPSKLDLSQELYSINTFKEHIQNNTNPEMLYKEGFEELFSYGLVSPIVVDNFSVKNNYKNVVLMAQALDMFDFVVNDPLGEKKLEWSKNLKRYFSSLQKDDLIQKLVYDITIKELLEYIREEGDTSCELTQEFASYIVKEIGSEAYTNNIKYTIQSMLNIEKRPSINPIEIAEKIIHMYPDQFKFESGWFTYWRKDMKKIQVDVYGPVWSKAHLMTVSDNLIKNCDRTIGVCFLDKMVQKLLEMTIDMFNREFALKEQNKIAAKKEDLKDLRLIIGKYKD